MPSKVVKKPAKVVKVPKEKKTVCTPAKNEPKDETAELLLPEIREYFQQKLGFTEFTPVQQCAIKYFLKNYDCIVQAPTGSGKTLAYILPLLQILYSKCKQDKTERKPGICGLILVPSAELVKQVSSVIKPILVQLGFTLASLNKRDKDEQKKIKNDCVVIGTPARFRNLAESQPEVKSQLKMLEILIIDEADRFNMADFKDATTRILGMLPKQRRTGLFSATQAKEFEDLIKFGLRNPVRLEVGNNGIVVDEKLQEHDDDEEDGVLANKKEVAPSTLVNTYAVVDPSHKVLCLYKYLMQMKGKKVLVFFCSRFAVLYFERVLSVLFSGARKVISMHGRSLSRGSSIAKFNSSKDIVCLATDLAGRGLDLMHVDAVVQFDIPKQSSSFIHRIGRAGRNGEPGESLAIYTKQEAAYPDFLSKHENIKLVENAIVKVCDDAGANKCRQKIIKAAAGEREFLELGTVAFVAMINAYLSHDSQIVAKLWDQDIGALANAYGLLKLPRTNESRKMDCSSFCDPRIDTGAIAYKDKEKEEKRQEMLKTPRTKLTKQSREKMFESKRKRKPVPVENGENVDDSEVKYKKKKRKLDEWEELQQSSNLMKKFKRGKITKEALDEGMDDM